MKFTELIEAWEKEAAGELAEENYSVRLPLTDAAKLEALAEIYPGRSREQLIAELLSVALDEVVASFPYVQGDQVIATDEEGDPIYEDVGHTPQFLNLVHQHVERMREVDGELAGVDQEEA